MELDWVKNLGTADRIMRIIIGATLLVLVITNNVSGWWATGAVILAIIQFFEAFFGY
ncbi:YgaP family membrane protein [Sporomusa sp.]|uniref:YgaP family membrane protein n=1 Tax=Sporomusa sp. TaxID=2078658 RepID=UPI0039C9221B